MEIIPIKWRPLEITKHPKGDGEPLDEVGGPAPGPVRENALLRRRTGRRPVGLELRDLPGTMIH